MLENNLVLLKLIYDTWRTHDTRIVEKNGRAKKIPSAATFP